MKICKLKNNQTCALGKTFFKEWESSWSSKVKPRRLSVSVKLMASSKSTLTPSRLCVCTLLTTVDTQCDRSDELVNHDASMFATVNTTLLCTSHHLETCTSLISTVHWGKVISVPVPLSSSTSANTPAERNQRFHLRTKSLWIPVTNPGRTPPIMPTWAFKP